ncbi:MAG: transposase [Chloroflexota bacterium]
MSSEPTNILILEQDRAFAVRLVRALGKIGAFNVSVVPSVRDGCLQLMQDNQDVAFIPVSESSKIMRSFRAVQPDIRLILMTPTSDYEVPKTYSGSVQAVMIKSLIDVELPVVLEKALEQPLFGQVEDDESAELELEVLDTTVMDTALQQVRFSRLVQAVIFARTTKLLSFIGELTEQEAATVGLHVGRDWHSTNPTRIQFLHLPARKGDLLLYSHQVVDHYFLTMVAAPETPIGELRLQASKLVVTLRRIVLGQTATLTGRLVDGEKVDGRSSYAIVWRPTQTLSSSLIIPLRRALDRIASTNACILTHTQILPDLVHVVVNCPPGRDSAWVSYLLKQGSEKKIQEEFGVVAHLWDKGYHAIESADPLSENELKLFLERMR